MAQAQAHAMPNTNDPIPSMANCLEKNNWLSLEQGLRQHAERCLNTGQGEALSKILDAVPEAAFRARPWLAYWLAKVQIETCLTSALKSFERAHAGFLSAADIAGESYALGGILDVLWLEWDDCSALDPWLQRLAAMRVRLQASDRQDLLLALSRSAFAGLSIRRPGDPELLFWEEFCLKSLSSETYTPNFLLRGLQLMIHYTWGRGDRARSSLVLETLRSKTGKSPSDPVGACIFHVVEAAHRHWFDTDTNGCSSVVTEGLALSQRLSLPHWDVPMLNCILFKVCSLEQLDECGRWLDQLKIRILLDPRPHDQAIHYHFQAYKAWLLGHGVEAAVFGEQAYRIALDSGFAYSPVYYGLALAAIENETDNKRRAWARLAATRRLAMHQHSDVMSFLALMQGAAMALSKNRDSVVLAYLRPALAIGARQHYFAIPWVKRNSLSRLLASALKHDLECGYVEALITSLALSPPDAKSQLLSQWPWPHRVRVLGGVEIHSERISDKETGGKAPVSIHRLLMQLVTAGPDGLNVERLQDKLWPDASDQAYARLKTAISRLRTLFGDRDAVLHVNQRVKLNAARVWVDAWALELAARQAAELDTKTILAQLNDWRGPIDGKFLNDSDDLYYPVRLEDAYLLLVGEAARRHETKGDWESALALWRRAAMDLEDEPVLEGMARSLRALGRPIRNDKILNRHPHIQPN